MSSVLRQFSSSLLPFCNLVAHPVGGAHGLRNEMHLWLRQLHTAILCSNGGPATVCPTSWYAGEKDAVICALTTITAERHLVAQPVGGGGRTPCFWMFSCAQCLPTLLSRASTTSLFAPSILPEPMGQPVA
jgi:hypothetical protein